MTNHWVDIKNADLVMVMGGNAAEAHPCGFKWVTEAKANRGARLIVVDPRFTRTAAVSDYYSHIRPGSDIVFLMAMINWMIQNDKVQWEYVRNFTNAAFIVKDEFGWSDGLFTGIATDEVYLTRAESYARAGNKTAALADLNTLLQARMKTGTFIPVAANSAAEALTIILQERRKELLMRCTRWMDIKRLNKEGAAITLKRILNNQVYLLPPNDLRYAMAIPEYIIDITGMPQNPR